MPNANLVAARNQLRTLVSIYNSNFDQYQQATYNETQVRVDFVNPFFQLLGWDVLNEAGLPQHLREVTHEATVLVEENGAHRSKKPDYSFKVGTEILFFLETKKPSVNITADRAPSFQLRRYGWSGNLKVSVLTNFTDLFIYDCTVRPVEGDEIGTALIAHYHYTEYEDKFEEIYSLLSKESVLNGDFQRIFGNVRGAMRREPFDAYFLDQIRGWRNQLGSDVVRNNPNVDAVTLNIFVQRILNRSIFLRICEDKNLENYESLKRITTYQELKDLFAVADQKYDSGLFEMLDEDRLIISDAVIIDIFQSLYYPNNSYEFGVVDPYIIGQIYELFLAETLEIEANGQVVSVKKPEVVDAQGTVNTPKNITDIIVNETLSSLYAGKTPEEVANYHIADICCGSGNFLLSAFEYVMNFHIEYLRQNKLEESLQNGSLYQLPGTQSLFLSYEQKRDMMFSNQVIKHKKDFLHGMGLEEMEANITLDSPIPYSLDKMIDCLTALDQEMVPGARAGAEKKGPYNGQLTRFIQRLETKRKDKRLNFMFSREESLLKYDYMDELCCKLMLPAQNGKKGVKIIDFSEVPSDILPLIVSLIARVVFSVQQWSQVGERHPIAIFCDEAHLYIPAHTEKSIDDASLVTFERISKEGRKYGVGLVVISQRPSEVNRTVLSQSNNFIAMRLTNADDQAVVKRLLPDSLGDYAEMLPILDIGEALIVGDASLLPSRIRIAPPKLKPRSATIDFWDEWAKETSAVNIRNAIEALRKQSK